MKRIIFPFFISFYLTLFGCVMCGPFGKEYLCDIKVDKVFYIPIAKTEIFKTHLTPGHPYSQNYPENLTDSMYYIYCPCPDIGKRSAAIFECKILCVSGDSTLIQTKRVAMFSIIPDEADEAYFRNLPASEYLELFTDNFISHLKKVDKHDKFFQDNKRVEDIWRAADGNRHAMDSLNKVYKKKHE